MTPRKRILGGFLESLWRLVSASPSTVLTVGAALVILSALSASFFLDLNADQNRLVSPEVPFFKRYLEHLENFGDQEYLYIVIRTGGTEDGKRKAKEFAESLAGRLRKHPELIRAIYYRISPQDFGDRALLFASHEEAEMLTKTLIGLAPFINNWLKDGSLAGLLDEVGGLLGEQKANLVVLDPSLLGQSLGTLEVLLKDINQNITGTSSGKSHFDLTGSRTHYFFTSNGRLLIMRLLPEKDFGTMDVIGKPLQTVREALEATRAEFPEVQAGLTGRPALQADEMKTSNRDMTRAAVIAFILVGILFMIILHGWLRPLLVLTSLVMAIALTFGFATVTVGELNILSMVFVLVLVGIGVDFGVHIMMRYVEFAKSGLGVDEAVRNSIFRSGPGVILGATTSACAFYSVMGSDFLGLAELGQIGGTGVLFSLLSMLTILPAMLLIAGKRDLFPSSQPRMVAMPFLEHFSKRPLRLLIFLLAASFAALPGLFKIRFNYNILELQAKGLESVEYEQLLIESSDESTWYAILTAKTITETKRLIKQVEKLPSVGKVESILDFIPGDQTQKSALYAKAARALDVKPADPPSNLNPDPNALVNALRRLLLALEDLEEKLFAAGAGTELAWLDQSIGHLENSLELLEQDSSKASMLKELEYELYRYIAKSLQQLKRYLTTDSVKPEDLPVSLRSIFVGKDGHNQIKVIPSKNVWDFDELERFVSELRQVDPKVSGVPVTVLESARLMHRTLLSAAGLTLVLVSLILWIYSRSISYVLLTLLPLGVGVLWLLELMGWFGLNFNLANFFAIPILIAIGVHGGVHLLARWKELPGNGGLFFTSTPTAVALSFTTTMIGFGGLIFAHHQGMASLGAIMVLGSLTSMLACLLVLPGVLKLIGDSK